MITKRSNVRLVGRSTDTKPINVDNGTILFCMNTNKKYIFDAQNKQWHLYTEGYVEPELPAVAAADNGDVLTVVDGKWAKTEPKTLDDLYDVVIELPTDSAVAHITSATLVKGNLADAIAAMADNEYISVLVKWANYYGTSHGVYNIVPNLEYAEGDEFIQLNLIAHLYNFSDSSWVHANIQLFWTADGITSTEPSSGEEDL